jgi:hypothetical protein
MHNVRDYDIKHSGAVEQSDGSYLDDFGDISWYNRRGQYHKEDGPAVIDGRLHWYYLGVEYNFNLWCMLLNKSDEDKMMLRLRYA